MKAVIPAAGYGTRLLPATKAQPKEMLPVVDKPAIQYVIEEAISSGIDDILVITGRGKRAIEDHFDKSFELESSLREEEKHDYLKQIQSIADLGDIHYIRQKELKGLGHAVYCARKYVGNQPFVVMLGDTITLTNVNAFLKETSCTQQLLEVFSEKGCAVIAVERIPLEKVERYGIIKGYEVGERLYKVESLVEKPPRHQAPSNLAIFGRYVLTPEIFACLEQTPPGKKGEIQLTDALNLLLRQQDIFAYEVTGERYDIGSRLDWLKANIEVALKRENLGNHLLEYFKELTEEERKRR